MQPRCTNQRITALTRVEVLVIIAVLAVLSALLLSNFYEAIRKAQKSNCYNNLRMIGLSFLVWGNDYNGKFPMEVSVTKGGRMELADTGNVVAIFQIMTNEMSTPKILLCPRDRNHVEATNFAVGFGPENISYFIGVDANTNHPRAFLCGDDNFAVGGVPIKSGLLALSANAPVSWTAARHKLAGNIGCADGSVEQSYDRIETNSVRFFVQQTGFATNRLAIP